MGGDEMDEAMRAYFPLSFGKPSKSQQNPSLAHSLTRRSAPAPPPASAPNPNSKPNGDEEEDDGTMVGPPPPPPASTGDEGEGEEEAMIGPPRPPPASRGEDEEGEEEDAMIGPPLPPPQSTQKPSSSRPDGSDGSDDDSDEEFDEDSPDDSHKIPLSNEIVLRGHTKVVSALAVDHTGSRVISGSYDYTVRMYDFQGMNSKLQSFRQLEPFEGHQVRSLSWSPTSDKFLCVTGSAQANQASNTRKEAWEKMEIGHRCQSSIMLYLIYDRDGLTLGEFVRGDMYIRDLKNTKGHISGLTGGEWNPKSKETILTSSEDGSLRLWDVNDFTSQKQVVKPKLVRPSRIPVTACAWDFEGKRIVGGIGDGSIQLWTIKTGWGSRPDIYVEKAHSDDITGLKFSTDGQILLSRSMDATLKVWDLRQMKSPVKVFGDLPNHYAQTNVGFSPDEQLICTGTSIEKNSTSGSLLCFFDRKKLELFSRVGISPSLSVIRCLWHPRINQVFATVGDKKEGGTRILYDPSISQRGALVCVGRAPRRKSVDDYEVHQPVIHNPHALPLFRDQPSRKRQREKILKDPLKSHKPDLPVNGPGFGGRVGTTKGSLLTQYLMKQGGLIKETWMDEDPREAILKYADAAAQDPKFIAPAYAETQPKPMFAKSDSEDEDNEK
ncbi:WD repeat-containing protein 70 [Rhynchospora pubera]|uniref:WD repeat-containing protein 70 n=1 Tax=Rhynchospora pubera TaxID=906938 RepID=A0AAV8E5X8_9POAL|nr:WD repeat-containing protein 70 [Rhynchospora pubera]